MQSDRACLCAICPGGAR